MVVARLTHCTRKRRQSSSPRTTSGQHTAKYAITVPQHHKSNRLTTATTMNRSVLLSLLLLIQLLLNPTPPSKICHAFPFPAVILRRSFTTNRSSSGGQCSLQHPPSSSSSSTTVLHLLFEFPSSTGILATAASTAASVLVADAATIDAAVGVATTEATATAALSNRDIWIVFLAGVFPFGWATIEFWRRVTVGESFGTSQDSVVIKNTIGNDNASPLDSRGRRVLGRGALVTAVVLFVMSFGTLGLVVYSVMSSGPPPPVTGHAI